MKRIFESPVINMRDFEFESVLTDSTPVAKAYNAVTDGSTGVLLDGDTRNGSNTVKLTW